MAVVLLARFIVSWNDAPPLPAALSGVVCYKPHVTLKQFIPLFIAALFLIRAVYPKPIFLRTTRDRHPEQLIARLCLGALGLLSLWVWYRMARPH